MAQGPPLFLRYGASGTGKGRNGSRMKKADLVRISEYAWENPHELPLKFGSASPHLGQ
jgi:hypothetical protein